MTLPLTFVTIMFDETMSMYSRRREAVDAYNRQVDALNESGTNQDIRVSLFPIRERAYPCRFRHALGGHLPHLEYVQYNPNAGRTAIVDGTIAALSDSEEMMRNYPDASFLLVLITDGEENQAWDKRRLGLRIEELQNTDRWTFAFSVPRGKGKECVRQFGVLPGNILEWETGTVEGFERMSQAQSQATTGYFNLRSTGARSSKAYYQTNITPEISKAIEKEVPRAYVGKFKEFTVLTDKPIKDFFRENKIPFSTGRLYYELLKPETVQPSKELVLQDRTDPTQFFHGRHARELLNLPTYANIEVHPGVHGKWRIFVQSTSNNRKLIGGSGVLIK